VNLGLRRNRTCNYRQYVFGDQVYDGIDKSPQLPIKFDLGNLIAKRTFVFARAGYGQSRILIKTADYPVI